MFAIAVALILAASPAPSAEPVCADPGVPVEQCTTWQLPGEQIGRQIDGPDGRVYVVVGLDATGAPILEPVEVVAPTTSPAPVPAPKPVSVLAYTGVPTGPYAAAGAGLILAGAGLVITRRRHSPRC